MRLEAALGGVAGSPADLLATETLGGEGEPEPALTMPYRGQRLRGDDLRRRLDTWVAAGVVEPTLREAVGAVLDNPDWLRLEGRTVVVLGAGAEMGPLRSLLRWGATVAAVDLPRPELWNRVLGDTSGLAGRVLVPATPGGTDLAERAGVDLVHDLPAATGWVCGLPGPLVIGNYVYADGATNVRVSMAVDALTERLRAARPDDVALAFLATPTDVFAVPGEAVDALAPQAYADRRHLEGAARRRCARCRGGRLLRRNYVPGADPGINDCWCPSRAPTTRSPSGCSAGGRPSPAPTARTVSINVAPPTRTRSVVKNRGAGGGVRRRAPLRRRGVRAGHLQRADGGAARARPAHRGGRRATSTPGRTRRTPPRTAGCGARPTPRAARSASPPCSAPPPPAPDAAPPLTPRRRTRHDGGHERHLVDAQATVRPP